MNSAATTRKLGVLKCYLFERMLAYNFLMHLSEEERGHLEEQLLQALEEALDQFQQAPISEREAARTKYLQAISNFTQFVAEYLPPGDELGARKVRRQVA